jgi:hypothetical protein
VVGDDLFLDTGIDSLPNAQELGPLGPRPPGPGTDDRNLDDFDPVARPGGTERDGLFQEGEPLADAGHRVLLTPRLGMPLRLLDLFEVYPEVGWHQTLYGSDAQGFEERGLFTARADLRTRLRRRFAGAVHVLEPSLGYAFVSERGQERKPLYVPATAVPQRRLRQLDLENRVLDPADRIDEVNSLTLALGNRLYGRGGEAAGRLLADVTLSASYEAADGDFGGIYLDGHAHAWGRSDAWLILGLDPERGRLAEALVDFAWNFERGHRLGFGYRYLRDVGRFYEDFQFATPRFSDFEGEFDRVDQLLASARLVISDRWALTYQGGFSFEKSILLANRAGIEYTSRCECWSIGIDVAQNRVSGVSIALSYSLKGLGRDDVARAARRRRDAPGLVGGW